MRETKRNILRDYRGESLCHSPKKIRWAGCVMCVALL